MTVGEESAAGGFAFAGVGISGKVVQTSVAGSLEITDPYTGELIITVMGQNRVTAQQIGADAYRIVSYDGGEEYLNIEYTTAKEMIKQQVQVELVDYLFYEAFKKLVESRPEYLTQRLHYRVGRVQGVAQELAAKDGLSDLSNAVPVNAEGLVGPGKESMCPTSKEEAPKEESKQINKAVAPANEDVEPGREE